MEEKSNHLNNTLNIFALLNIKENLASPELKDNIKINIKKIWNCVQNPEINRSEIKSILKTNIKLMFFTQL